MVSIIEMMDRPLKTSHQDLFFQEEKNKITTTKIKNNQRERDIYEENKQKRRVRLLSLNQTFLKCERERDRN